MMKCLMPGKLGTMTLKNRVIFPSMCNFYGDDEGNITPRLEAYVRARAEGGAAAIIMPASPFGTRNHFVMRRKRARAFMWTVWKLMRMRNEVAQFFAVP